MEKKAETRILPPAVDDAELAEILEEQRREWQDKIAVVPLTYDYGTGYYWVTMKILDGEPDNLAVIAAAAGWGLNYGGIVLTYEQDGQRYARVKVYCD